MKRRLLTVLLSVVAAVLLSACDSQMVVTIKNDLQDKGSSNQSVESLTEEKAEEKTENLNSSVKNKTENIESETEEPLKDNTVSSVKQKNEKEISGNGSNESSEKADSSKEVGSAKKDKNIIKKETESNPIGREKAKKIALTDAKVDEKDAVEIDIELDREKNAVKYEVDFKANGREYEYDIDLYSGKILYKNSKKDDDYVALKSTESQKNTLISKEDALSKALSDASVPKSKAKELEIELDKENKTSVYEIEFKVDRIEYKYEIHAESGKILDKETEK